MKQTNNAIKFLMAQYRAIFRNANLKMFLAAATAAAALSAGQAQAAKGSTFDNTGFKNDAAVTITATGSDQADDAGGEYKNFTISGGKAADDAAFTNTQENVLKVTGGKEASGSVFKGADADAVGTIDLANTKLIIAGSADNATDAVVKVGEGTSGAAVTLGTVEASKGTIEIVKGSLTATSVDLNDKSKLTLTDGSVSATNLNLNTGSNTEITKGTLGGTGNKIIINNGATVEGAGAAAGNAKLVGDITLSGGKINVATQKNLTIGGSFVAEKGTVTLAAADANVVLENGGTFKKDTLATSGAITVKGNTVLEKGAVVAASLGDAATITIGSEVGKNATLTLDSSDFKLLTDVTKENRKIKAANAANTISEIHFSDSGDAALDLGVGKLGILQDAGTLEAKVLDVNTAGKFKLSGKSATFKGGTTINNNTEFAFDSFSAGKEADGTELKVSGGAVISVKDGLTVIAKDATNAVLNIVDGKVNLNGTAGTSGTLTASGVTLNAGNKDAKVAQFNITDGDWTVADLTVTKGQANVTGGKLSITGKLTTAEAASGVITANDAAIDATKATSVDLKAGGIKLENTATMSLDKKTIFTASGLDDTKFKTGAIAGDANTTLTIMDGENKLHFDTAEAYQDFYTKSGFKGMFDVDVKLEAQSGSMTFDKILGGLDNETAYKNVTATTDGSAPLDKVVSVGKVEVSADKDLELGAGGALTLNNANGGNFVTKTDADGKKVVAGVTFKDKGNSLTLKDDGKIGSITAQTSGFGSLTIGAQKSPSNVVLVSGSNIGDQTNAVGDVTINGGSSLTVESGSVYTTNLDVADSAKFVVVGDITTTDAQVDGYLKANTLTLSGTVGQGATSVEHNFTSANVEVTKLVLAEKNVMNIGKFGVDNGSASVVADTLILNKGGLFIDPNYDQTKSSAVVMNLSGAATDINAGTLDGKVAVGKNAAFGVGFNSLAEMDEAIGGYLTDGHFTEDTTNGGVHNALVLNKQITVDTANGGIMVGETASISGTKAATVDFGANSALVITDNVFEDNGGVKTGTAIAGATTVTFGSGSELVLVGDFNAKDDNLQIFSATPTGTMTVKSLNGLLEGKWTGGKLDLSLTTNQDILNSAFVDSAAPIRELLLDSKKGELGAGAGLGRDLINEVSSVSLSGAVADAAAHAATYAGAQQAAVAAVGTMAEAVGGRVGSMGVEAATIAATGSQANGGVWLSPMYKSVDADGFNAQGGSYGADVDLAGVAFGADTVNGNMRFGAVFNLGSGDADGKGNGNGLKDEFDYYGFGIYSVMGFGNFALVGDASLNVISHDVEGLGLKGEADTTAVTMGITGQYTIANPMVDVTPHLGARFIRLDTDSYDLTNAEGVVATTDFEVQNVFSVPLGVTLSKAFEMGGWSLAPSADLSITFNTGDTEVDSTTRFTGINRNIGLNTEVLDEVTYGVAVGLGAQYGAFGTQIGINYTGSENTDAFGVNANARYMF